MTKKDKVTNKEQPIYIQLNAQTVRVVNWMLTATADPGLRELYSCFYIEEEQMIAADGFRLYKTNTPIQFKEFEGKVFRLHTGRRKVRVDEIVRLEFIDRKFPDIYEKIIPSDEPTVQIQLQARFLRDALYASGKENVVIRIYQSDDSPTGQLFEIYIGEDRYSLIMPMYQDEKSPPFLLDPKVNK
jgi:hypothetical protein